MIIADLNYLETAAEVNLQGGTAAAAGSTAGGFGLFVSSGTGARTRSTQGWFYRSSSASTYGYASAVAGGVSSSSYAFSAA